MNKLQFQFPTLNGGAAGNWLLVLIVTLLPACVSTVQYEQRIWEQANAAYAKQSYSTAFSFYLQAAELGVVEAQFNVARMYQRGVGVEANEEQAKVWYEKAAYSRLPQAQYYLSKLYQQDDSKNAPSIELYWLHQAADSGLAQAQYELAQRYYAGGEKPENIALAKKWYLEAAEQGVADAQFNVAQILEKEKGVLQVGDNAYGWYQKAAKQDHIQAKAKLGASLVTQRKMEEKGNAVDQLKQAALKGHAESQYNLALLYQRGKGVERDPRRAVHWLKQAAQQDLVEAQYDLGVHYVRGNGVRKNSNRAYFWFDKAAKQGHKAAAGYLQTLSNSLMFTAVANNDFRQLARLLANGADINTVGASGYTPLHYAAHKKRTTVARYLLVKGADVDAKSDDGFTPLFIAVTQGNSELAKILIAHGADVNSRNNSGVSVLDYALSGKYDQLVRLLSSKGAQSFAYSSN